MEIDVSEYATYLRDINLSIVELANCLKELGDPRETLQIRQDLAYIASGKQPGSGTVCAPLHLLWRRKQRLTLRRAALSWKAEGANCVATKGRFKVTLEPRSKGRWKLHIFYPPKWTLQWVKWSWPLDTAKARALLYLDIFTEEMVQFQIEKGTIKLSSKELDL